MSEAPDADTALLADQVAYYRARAGEYDEWWFRTGRYDRGAEFNAAWFADVAEVERALDAFVDARSAARRARARMRHRACSRAISRRESSE